MTPLEKAIHIAGRQARLADRCGAKPAHIWNWLHRDGRVSSEFAIPVAAATDYGVTPHDLRPDLYPNPWDGLPPDVAMAKFPGLLLSQAA